MRSLDDPVETDMFLNDEAKVVVGDCVKSTVSETAMKGLRLIARRYTVRRLLRTFSNPVAAATHCPPLMNALCRACRLHRERRRASKKTRATPTTTS
jgi:hypothetical protein